MRKQPTQSQPFEAVQRVLAHLERQAKTYSYDELLAPPELPIEALSEGYHLTRLDDPAKPEALPSLLVENETGQAQVEVCPFGPLALISSDGNMDTDPLAEALLEAGITPLFPHDLDAAGKWHGTPLVRWLFPTRLPDALAQFETLRGG